MCVVCIVNDRCRKSFTTDYHVLFYTKLYKIKHEESKTE